MVRSLGAAWKADEELAAIGRVLAGLEGELGQQLAGLVTTEEIEAFAARCARLRTTAVFPGPSGGDACGSLAAVLGE